jgi:hypothetical protein
LPDFTELSNTPEIKAFAGAVRVRWLALWLA